MLSSQINIHCGIDLCYAPCIYFGMVAPSEISALRRDRGESQKEFGVSIGVSQSNVSRFEDGTLEPTGSTLVLLERLILEHRTAKADASVPAEAQQGA